MKIDIENPRLLKLMTFVPPLLGIIVFSYIVKFSNNILIPDRLPLYQGITSYFSLILIGFTYIKSRYSIDGIKIILPLLLIIILPLIGYYLAKVNIVVTIFIVAISFLSSAILYLLLIKNMMFYYLVFSIVNSVILPMTLIAGYDIFFFLVIFFLVIFCLIYKQVRPTLTMFNYLNSGRDVLSSIFLHSPYILLPFFDFIIQKALGKVDYNNYVLFSKYINGGITLMFSYKQLNLMFSGELKRMNLIVVMLFSIMFVSTVIVFFDNRYIFVFMIALYSLGVNLSSLIIRSKLMRGIDFYHSMIGLVFVSIYFSCIYVFKDSIRYNKNLFVFFMSSFTIIPSLLLSINKRKKDC